MKSSNRMRGHRAASILLAMGLIAGLAACTNDPLAEESRSNEDGSYSDGASTIKPIAEAERGEPVAFAGITDSGAQVSSADYSGEVLVVNFWYAECGPCRAEAPILEEVAQEYAGEGAEFLGVNISDQAETAASFADTFDITYPSVIDTNDKKVTFAFASYVPLSAPPVTVILDKKGRVAVRIIGQLRDASILSTYVRDTLAEAS